MSTFPNSPLLVKGGLVLIDADTGALDRIVALQYNPETLSRTLQVQGAGPEGGDTVEAMRLKGPPVETLKIEAIIDATDQLEFPDDNQTTVRVGIHPQLAALETIIYPRSDQILANRARAESGVLEIIPMTAPLTLFVWSRNRVLPVRLTEFSITEESFDPNLNPIRAKINLGMRVLSVNDLGLVGKGASLFLTYQQQKERLAMNNATALAALGLESLP